jgi:hypothetical protein
MCRYYHTYTSLMCVGCILELDARCYLLTLVALVVWWTVNLRVCSCYCSVLMSALFGKLFLLAVMRSAGQVLPVRVCTSS